MPTWIFTYELTQSSQPCVVSHHTFDESSLWVSQHLVRALSVASVFLIWPFSFSFHLKQWKQFRFPLSTFYIIGCMYVSLYIYIYSTNECHEKLFIIYIYIFFVYSPRPVQTNQSTRLEICDNLIWMDINTIKKILLPMKSQKFGLYPVFLLLKPFIYDNLRSTFSCSMRTENRMHDFVRKFLVCQMTAKIICQYTRQ